MSSTNMLNNDNDKIKPLIIVHQMRGFKLVIYDTLVILNYLVIQRCFMLSS